MARPVTVLTALAWLFLPARAQAACDDLREAQQMMYAFPDDPQAFETFGEAQACWGQCVDAWATLSTAVEMGSPASVLRAAESCMAQARTSQSCEDSVADAQAFVALEPTLPMAHTMLADALGCESSCVAPLAALAKAVEFGGPADLLASADLSCITQQIEQGACAGAASEAQAALAYLPASPELHVALAGAQSCAGACEDAWSSHRTATQAGLPNLGDNPGAACLEQKVAAGNCADALDQAQSMATQAPRDADAAWAVGASQQCLGQHRDAIASFGRYGSLGGNAAKAQSAVAASRANLASLTVRVTAANAAVPLPKPTFTGVPAELLKDQGGGVYVATDIDPGAVSIAVDDASGFWPATLNLTLQGGSTEEVELSLTRAAFANVEVGEASPALSLQVVNPRSGELVDLQPGGTTRVPVGPSTLHVTVQAAQEAFHEESEFVLEEGTQSIHLPWAWQVVDARDGRAVAGTIEHGAQADLSFDLAVPGGIQASHSSAILAAPGQLLTYEVDPSSHPYGSAKSELNAATRQGALTKTTHWTALLGTTAIEALALFEYSRALGAAADARAVSGAAGASDYDDSVAFAQLTRRNAILNATAGTALLSVDLLWLRPALKRRHARTSSLRSAADIAANAPLTIRPTAVESTP
jgi:hypothetical protein